MGLVVVGFDAVEKRTDDIAGGAARLWSRTWCKTKDEVCKEKRKKEGETATGIVGVLFNGSNLLALLSFELGLLGRSCAINVFFTIAWFLMVLTNE